MAYYVCERCHDNDMNATGCDFDFYAHDVIAGSVVASCHICGSIGNCVLCDAYPAANDPDELTLLHEMEEGEIPC